MSHAISETVLQVTVQRLGDATVIHLAGKLVRGEDSSQLRDIAFAQADARTIVLNLAQVERIDAFGLGMLLWLQEWARSRGTVLKLMNTVHQVDLMLQLTGLNRVFEFCSVRDLFCLMHRAGESYTHTAVA